YRVTDSAFRILDDESDVTHRFVRVAGRVDVGGGPQYVAVLGHRRQAGQRQCTQGGVVGLRDRRATDVAGKRLAGAVLQIADRYQRLRDLGGVDVDQGQLGAVDDRHRGIALDIGGGEAAADSRTVEVEHRGVDDVGHRDGEGLCRRQIDAAVSGAAIVAYAHLDGEIGRAHV